MNIDYRYKEGELLQEINCYIDKTYTEHYSQNKFQATEFIIDSGHGEGFTIGNCMKYLQRYGKKEGKNRKDLLKVIHYAIIALHIHDLESDTMKKWLYSTLNQFRLTRSSLSVGGATSSLASTEMQS